jgi:hypothetical protein
MSDFVIYLTLAMSSPQTLLQLRYFCQVGFIRHFETRLVRCQSLFQLGYF